MRGIKFAINSLKKYINVSVVVDIECGDTIE